MKAKYVVFLFACMAVSRIASGQTLFSENWDSGSIDPLKWEVRGSTTNAIGLELPVESEEGDFALALRGLTDPDFPGTNPTWLDNIMSQVQFDRGDQVGMQFKVWTKFNSNAQIGVHGGFHHISVAQSQQHYSQDLLNTPEAIFDYYVNDLRASESGDYIQGGPSFFEATAAIKANTKNGAATFRITLDEVQGALWEIIVPPTNPLHTTGEGDPEIYVGRDTRGVPNFGEQTGLPDTIINNQVMNAIGFGQGASLSGTTYVDDIIVFGPDGPDEPSLLGDFNNDGIVDAADYTVWRNHFGELDEVNINNNGDGMNGVDAVDYSLWKTSYGDTGPGSGSGGLASHVVPEPGSALIVFLGLAFTGAIRWRQS